MLALLVVLDPLHALVVLLDTLGIRAVVNDALIGKNAVGIRGSHIVPGSNDGVGDHFAHIFAVLIASALQTLRARLEIIVVIRVALTAGEEKAGRARDALFDETSGKSGPIGRPLCAADDVGMSRKIQNSDIVFVFSRKTNEAHRVVCVGTATRQRKL